jgi:DNA-binding MarR family transcriptional regulator
MGNSHNESTELVLSLLEASDRIEKRLTHSLSSILGISFSEYELLSALQREHNATATRADLARAIRLTPSGVTRALQPLEKRRIVKTKRDSRDARRSLATLTAAGVELVDNATAVVADAIAGLGAVEALGASNRKQVAGFLADLVRD